MPLQACNCNNKTKPGWSKKSPTQGPNKKEIQQNEWVLFQTYKKAIHEAITKTFSVSSGNNQNSYICTANLSIQEHFFIWESGESGDMHM